jgi:hypothetical protein
LAKPETLGDIAIIQILNIVQKKIKGLILDEKEQQNETNKEKNLRKIEHLIQSLNENNLIQRMIDLLESSSFTKKDVSILILCTLSAHRNILSLLLNKEVLGSLIRHINSFKKTSNFLLKIEYKNFREHIIASLQLLRRIYVKEINLRKQFLELGGVQLIYEFLTSGDVDIIQEVLYNLEDLIYV